MNLSPYENKKTLKTFLFTYRYCGAEYGMSIDAASESEAKERIKALGLARYDGEVKARIPFAFGPFARFSVWIKNTLYV